MPYLPALDGLRAVALVAILCFHSGFTWIHGGYLPLTDFFVLSGFLITSLLLLEKQRTGRLRLGTFWGRRARRLVPGALLALALVAVYTAAIDHPVPGLRGDVWAALTWVTNWRFIFMKRSYADLFGDPSPLQHFWSLAVEEQFYLFLPLFAFGTLFLAKGKRWLFATLTVVLATASVITMRLLYEPGKAPLRAYFGTDTRAAELLVGVLLAMLLIGPNGLRRFRGPARVAIDVLGIVALGTTIVLWFAMREYDARLYRGGLLGISFLAALIVTAGTQERTLVTRVLAIPPLPALGRISYGVYLYHWPLFLWLNEDRTGLTGGTLFALRCGVTLVMAVASYHLLELPIRGGWARRPTRLQLAAWANASVAVAAVLVVVTSTTAPALTTVQTADVAPRVIRATTTTTTTPTSTSAVATTLAPATGGTTKTTRGPSTTRPVTTTPATSPPTTPPPPPPLKVMVVGDSIAVNLATGLEHHLKQYGDIELLNYAFNGCPAVVDGVMRWPDGTEHTVPANCAPRRSEWAGKIASFHPDIVLIHSSIYDIYDREASGWSDFKSIGDPTFDSWLRSSQQQVMSTLRSGGARVVWATVPCARWEPNQYPNHFENTEGNRRIEALDGLIRGTGATIADLDGELCPGGQFSSTVEGVGNARPDGVHMTDAAAYALADRWLAPLLLSMR